LLDDFYTEDLLPMSTHFKTLALLTATAAVSAAAGAQNPVGFQTALDRMAPPGFATTTLTLMPTLDIAVAPSMLSAPEGTSQPGNAVDATTGDFNTWTVVTDIETDDEKNEANHGAGFLGSTMGRVSMVGLAGLAGGSYLALRSDGSSPGQPVFDAAASAVSTPAATAAPTVVTPGIVVTPEPASVALMALGLGGIALIARRRGSI